MAEQEQMRRELEHYQMVAARLIAAVMGKRKTKTIPADVWAGTEGVKVFSDESAETGSVTIRVEYDTGN